MGITDAINVKCDGQTVTEIVDKDGNTLKTLTAEVENADQYCKPSGSKSITANGTHDVKEYAYVNVDVPVSSESVTPSIGVNENGLITVSGNGVNTVTHQLSSADDADFVASNILKGVSIFGLTGTAEASAPAWIDSVCVQTFTPEADTNEAQTFALTGMSGAPQLIIVGTTQKTPDATRDYGGGVYALDPFGIDKQSDAAWGGVAYCKLTSAGYSHANFKGPTNVTASSITINPPTYSNTACYWRSGVTYTIIALVLKAIS